MSRHLIDRWKGVALSLLGIVATVWLALSGQLGLYIHPRYFVFTVVMAVLAGVIVIAGFAILPGADEEHDHEDHDFLGTDDEHRLDRPRTRGLRRLGGAAGATSSLLIVAGAFVALILLPPQSLSTGGVQASDLNAPALTSAASGPAPELAGGDSASFTVADWAAILRQGADSSFLAGKPVDVVGFVTPDADDPENVFYLARYTVTCCAVDAQPVGIPVHLPGWQEEHDPQAWLQITGSFRDNAGSASTAPLVLVPDSVTAVDEPAEPYLF